MLIRNIENRFKKALSASPIIVLTGARQTGKTTLVKEVGKEKNYYYVTFDDLRFLSLAQNDPIGFISGLPKPVILDEVQRCPEIFLPIKKDVDENRIAGRYILTGSANPLMIPKLSNAFVGRMEIFTLFPLSQGELQGINENFIDFLFSDNPPPIHFEKIIKKDLWEKIIVGGYPLVQNRTSEERESWINGYITTLLQRDVQDLAHISGLAEFPNLLHLLALRAGNLLNVAELSRDSGITTSTLHRYLTLLETLFIIHFEQSWHANLAKRLVKAPKTYLIDSGILSFLMSINVERLISEPKLSGSILENFVLEELRKQATWNSTHVNFYHFRTISGTEIDIILENRAGDIIGIEIKASETVTANDFKGLKYLKEELGQKFKKGIVLYTGNEFLPFGPNIYALPISALWKRFA